MKDKETRHKKVQEMIDCYATSDERPIMLFFEQNT